MPEAVPVRVRISILRLAARAAALLSLLAGPVCADVYIWKDPETGRTRMTNIPPPWVREPAAGRRLPQVEVIRDGRLIDPGTALANPQPAPARAEDERRESEAPQSAREFEKKEDND